MNLRKLRQSKALPFFLLFLFLLVPFAAYFLRGDLLGHDPYGFLLLSCQNTNIIGASGLPLLLFSLLPCNILAIKALLFTLTFVSGCFVIKLATLFNKQSGWRASYLIFLAPVFVLDFAKFENEVFAYPILFAATYFFFRGIKESDRKSFFLSLALLVPAGMIWEGSIFFLLGFTLNVFFVALFSIPALAIWGRRIVGEVVRTNFVAEDLALKFHFPWLLNIGILGFFLDKLLMPQALFFFALGSVSAKFWPLSIPFLTVGAVLAIPKLQGILSPWLDRARLDLNQLFFLFAIVTVLATAQSVYYNPPNTNDWQAVDFSIEEANGEMINNDFGYGYWILWRGGKTESYGSLAREKEFGTGSYWVTEREGLDCLTIKEFEKIKVHKC